LTSTLRPADTTRHEFVPTGEVWIDNDIVEKERGFVLLHELHERNRMPQAAL